MALTSLAFNVALIIGQLILVGFYGVLGTLVTFVLFLRLGPKKFFTRVSRPRPPTAATDPMYGKHEMITLKSSGVTLHYVTKGALDQPLMLFLHGFPECWYAWRNQITHFSKNYRVVAIDLRGYGLSSKPSGVSNYRITALTRDVADVIQQLGNRSCILVGHDWGGVVAWATAILYPELINKLIIMNAPHLGAFRQQLSLGQLRRSWYIFFYQVPFVPELLVEANDLAVLKRVFQEKPMGLVNTTGMSSEDLEVFRYTFSQKGTANAAINYYRALLRYPNEEVLGRVIVPTIIIWGCRDMALGEALADASSRFCNNGRLKKIPEASHWVQQDRPDEVNRYMEEFLRETATI